MKLSDAIQLLKSDIVLFDSITHGGSTSDVDLGNGIVVPSLAKAISLISGSLVTVERPNAAGSPHTAASGPIVVQLVDASAGDVAIAPPAVPAATQILAIVDAKGACQTVPGPVRQITVSGTVSPGSGAAVIANKGGWLLYVWDSTNNYWVQIG